MPSHIGPFTLPAVDGAAVPVDPAAAPATLVVFTSNTCPYAVAWHDRLQVLARAYAAHGLATVQINANRTSDRPRETAEAGAERVARGEFAGPYLRDDAQTVAKTFGAQKTPHVYVLDGSGSVVYQGAPDADHEDESGAARFARDAIDAVLAGQPVAVPETPAVGCGIKWLDEDPALLAAPTLG